MTGREILEEVVALLGQVPEGDEAEELCEKLRDWLLLQLAINRRAREDSATALSERELEVLELVALGHTNPEIAERLEISVRTVETHRSHIQQKLGLSSRPELTRYALDTLRERYGDDITIHGPDNVEVRGGVLSFAFRDIHPHDVSQVLDQHNVCVRAGHHCAKPLMRVLDVAATARASWYLYNDRADIDALADALDGASDIFGLPL